MRVVLGGLEKFENLGLSSRTNKVSYIWEILRFIHYADKYHLSTFVLVQK
jgi:hypothetical protein